MIVWPAHIVRVAPVKAGTYILDVEDVAAMLGADVKQVYRWATTGRSIPKHLNDVSKISFMLGSWQPYSNGRRGFSIREVADFAWQVACWSTTRDAPIPRGVGVDWDAVPSEMQDIIPPALAQRGKPAIVDNTDRRGGTS